MSSFLRPVGFESCQTGLRERRRSSVNAIAAVPRLFSSAPSSQDQSSAVLDDDEHCLHTLASEITVSIPQLSTLKLAQLPDHASKITIPRHFKKPPTIDTTVYEVSTPTSSSPPTAFECRKEYFPEVKADSTLDPANMERIRWRLASGFFAYFMCGWGDGVTGTVLPYFMSDFHISFTLSSTLYAGGTIGFMFSTILIETLIHFLGQFDLSKTHWSWIPEFTFFGIRSPRKAPKSVGNSPSQARLLALLIASILHGSFFVMMGSRGSFWVMFFAYSVAAFARSILTATLNAYFVSGYKQSVGFAFGLWSFGGVVSPIVCQALIAIGIPYYQFYFGSLVLSGFNIAFLVATYMPTPREFATDRESTITAVAKHKVCLTPTSTPSTPLSDGAPNLPIKPETKGKSKALRTAVSMPFHWALSLFAMFYCGCETVTQAFMVSYLLGVRNADAKTAGYVTSGFWGGITVGRLLWGHYTPKLTYTQRKWVIQTCILLGLAMQITIWRVNSNIQNALAASIIGLLYGPVWPAILTLTTDILPPHVHMASMAITSAFASVGSSLFPFTAGLISSAHGIHTISYMTISLASTIAIFWMTFPSRIPCSK
ncbi:major facilitator superfamily domain-containing protein [Crepidotus variabilis]|uniref:Major facilitator superfamily domain-containing protein n=1 Tax=Crepidotus variabilis TaxID=179855 RepID=A0A9P6EUY5_9AGAR|nr:major facilitator superfamily domain-containing protein [Crepidotus variabilis]